jgi:hypothetical protein
MQKEEIGISCCLLQLSSIPVVNECLSRMRQIPFDVETTMEAAIKKKTVRSAHERVA